MRLSLILDATDRASRPLDRFRNRIDQTGRATDRTGRSVSAMGRHMERAGQSARGLGRAAEMMGARIASGAQRGTTALIGLERRLQISQARMERLAFTAGTFIGNSIRGGVVAGGALAAGGLYKIIGAGIQSENFMTQLVGLESGNAAAARKDMEWIKKIAAETPYDLAEVTQAFINARNAGIDPMNGSLVTLSDSAAALGKTFDDAIGMLADARTEQFERMREFGITPSQSGGKVMLRYVDRLGKEMVKIVKKNGADVERATLQILNEKFGGGGAALAKTTMGKWDALTDRLSQRAVKIWDSGFGDAVKYQLDRASKAFDDAEKDGSLDRWTKKASEGLRDVVNEIGNADWKAFRDDITGIAGAFRQLYGAAKEVGGALSEIRKWMADKETRADNWWGGVEWSPRGGLIYRAPNWARGKQGAASPSSVAPFRDEAARKRAQGLRWPSGNNVPFIPAGEPQSAPTATPEEWRRALQKPAIPLRRPAAPLLQQPTAKVEVTIKTPAGTVARPTKIAASGLDLEVNTGRAMGGFA